MEVVVRPMGPIDENADVRADGLEEASSAEPVASLVDADQEVAHRAPMLRGALRVRHERHQAVQP